MKSSFNLNLKIIDIEEEENLNYGIVKANNYEILSNKNIDNLYNSSFITNANILDNYNNRLVYSGTKFNLYVCFSEHAIIIFNYIDYMLKTPNDTNSLYPFFSIAFNSSVNIDKIVFSKDETFMLIYEKSVKDIVIIETKILINLIQSNLNKFSNDIELSKIFYCKINLNSNQELIDIIFINKNLNLGLIINNKNTTKNELYVSDNISEYNKLNNLLSITNTYINTTFAIEPYIINEICFVDNINYVVLYGISNNNNNTLKSILIIIPSINFLSNITNKLGSLYDLNKLFDTDQNKTLLLVKNLDIIYKKSICILNIVNLAINIDINNPHRNLNSYKDVNQLFNNNIKEAIQSIYFIPINKNTNSKSDINNQFINLTSIYRMEDVFYSSEFNKSASFSCMFLSFYNLYIISNNQLSKCEYFQLELDEIENQVTKINKVYFEDDEQINLSKSKYSNNDVISLCTCLGISYSDNMCEERNRSSVVRIKSEEFYPGRIIIILDNEGKLNFFDIFNKDHEKNMLCERNINPIIQSKISNNNYKNETYNILDNKLFRINKIKNNNLNNNIINNSINKDSKIEKNDYNNNKTLDIYSHDLKKCDSNENEQDTEIKDSNIDLIYIDKNISNNALKQKNNLQYIEKTYLYSLNNYFSNEVKKLSEIFDKMTLRINNTLELLQKNNYSIKKVSINNSTDNTHLYNLIDIKDYITSKLCEICDDTSSSNNKILFSNYYKHYQKFCNLKEKIHELKFIVNDNTYNYDVLSINYDNKLISQKTKHTLVYELPQLFKSISALSNTVNDNKLEELYSIILEYSNFVDKINKNPELYKQKNIDRFLNNQYASDNNYTSNDILKNRFDTVKDNQFEINFKSSKLKSNNNNNSNNSINLKNKESNINNSVKIKNNNIYNIKYMYLSFNRNNCTIEDVKNKNLSFLNLEDINTSLDVNRFEQLKSLFLLICKIFIANNTVSYNDNNKLKEIESKINKDNILISKPDSSSGFSINLNKLYKKNYQNSINSIKSLIKNNNQLSFIKNQTYYEKLKNKYFDYETEETNINLLSFNNINNTNKRKNNKLYLVNKILNNNPNNNNNNTNLIKNKFKFTYNYNQIDENINDNIKDNHKLQYKLTYPESDNLSPSSYIKNLKVYNKLPINVPNIDDLLLNDLKVCNQINETHVKKNKISLLIDKTENLKDKITIVDNEIANLKANELNNNNINYEKLDNIMSNSNNNNTNSKNIFNNNDTNSNNLCVDRILNNSNSNNSNTLKKVNNNNEELKKSIIKEESSLFKINNNTNTNNYNNNITNNNTNNNTNNITNTNNTMKNCLDDNNVKLNNEKLININNNNNNNNLENKSTNIFENKNNLFFNNKNLESNSNITSNIKTSINFTQNNNLSKNENINNNNNNIKDNNKLTFNSILNNNNQNTNLSANQFNNPFSSINNINSANNISLAKTPAFGQPSNLKSSFNNIDNNFNNNNSLNFTGFGSQNNNNQNTSKTSGFAQLSNNNNNNTNSLNTGFNTFTSNFNNSNANSFANNQSGFNQLLNNNNNSNNNNINNTAFSNFKINNNTNNSFFKNNNNNNNSKNDNDYDFFK